MVSITVTTHSANTITSTKNSKPFIRSKQTKASTDRVGKLTTPGMDSLRERLHAKGVSEDSAALITNARRSSTNDHYKSTWRKWHSWCSQRQFDSINCSVNKILQFLTECFNMGYKHSTIAGFRSAISAYHDPINRIPVGKESRISALLACAYNIRPPQPTFTGHSTRTASISKAKEVGVPTGGIFYHKWINTKDPHFQLSILKSFEERSSK